MRQRCKNYLNGARAKRKRLGIEEDATQMSLCQLVSPSSYQIVKRWLAVGRERFNIV